MKNKYFAATLMTVIYATSVYAQTPLPTPKLVVSIVIEQLRTDYLEKYAHLYGTNGFNKLLKEGIVYTTGTLPFYPADRASAITSISTGTSPYYNGIVGVEWFNRNTLNSTSCIKNELSDFYLPSNITTSTIGDELKIATEGMSVVYGIAEKAEAAILAAGHAADGAYWIGADNLWHTSEYYGKKTPRWLDAYNKIGKSYISGSNDRITEMTLQCLECNSMGKDDITDMLFVTYDAGANSNQNEKKNQSAQSVYTTLDYTIGKLISNIENTVGYNNVLFVISGTGYKDDESYIYDKYKIPSGTFYINRTSNLLNMYLGAIYGREQYIEACFYNQIYLNVKLIDQKRISMSDILSRSQIFLMQNSGVQNVYTSENLLTANDAKSEKIRNGFNIFNCGDIIIETAPGWQLVNEDNNQRYISNINFTPFPIIFYGTGKEPKFIEDPVTTDRIAPTISKKIQIRAPNACSSFPLF